jgi:hypothetical protein
MIIKPAMMAARTIAPATISPKLAAPVMKATQVSAESEPAKAPAIIGNLVILFSLRFSFPCGGRQGALLFALACTKPPISHLLIFWHALHRST